MRLNVALWMPLAVAAVGVTGTLVGAILGQLLAGRRENERWRREVQQEKARWLRERLERQEQWAREDAFRWHRERHETYARFLASLETYGNALQPHVDRLSVSDERLSEKDREHLQQLNETALQALASVDLMGSENVRAAADSAMDKYSYVDICLGMKKPDAAHTEEVWEAAHEALVDLREEMRLSLGVEAPLSAPDD